MDSCGFTPPLATNIGKLQRLQPRTTQAVATSYLLELRPTLTCTAHPATARRSAQGRTPSGFSCCRADRSRSLHHHFVGCWCRRLSLKASLEHHRFCTTSVWRPIPPDKTLAAAWSSGCPRISDCQTGDRCYPRRPAPGERRHRRAG